LPVGVLINRANPEMPSSPPEKSGNANSSPSAISGNARVVDVLDRRDAEPVLVAIVAGLHVGAELGVRRADPEEELLVVHRHFLHREHGLGAESPNQEIDLVARDHPLDGIGCIGDRLDLVGVGISAPAQ
jgi:hypothetical protein